MDQMTSDGLRFYWHGLGQFERMIRDEQTAALKKREERLQACELDGRCTFDEAKDFYEELTYWIVLR